MTSPQWKFSLNLVLYVSNSLINVLLTVSSWFQILKWFFKIPSKKCPDKAFFDPILKVFHFSTKLCNSDRFEDMHLNFDTTIFKSQHKKYLRQTFLISNLRIFGFDNMTTFFKIAAQNVKVKQGDPKFNNFHFCTKRCVQTN